MSQFLDSIRDVKNNYKTYDIWEQKQADDVAQRRYLSEKLDLPKDKVELTREKAKAVFRASDLMDKRSEDNCANMEQATGFVSMGLTLPVAAATMFYPSYLAKKGKALNNKQSMYFNALSIGLLLVSGIGIALWGNAKQKEASRIGRFQAKQNELKDVENFVIYTPEQVKVAENIAKKIPDKEDKKKNFLKVFADLKQMSKDKVEYEKYLKNKINNKEEVQKILSKEYTPEQMAQAEEDKEVIVNIVKDVNMSAENYSENVENAFDTIGMMSIITDIPIYYGVNKILKSFKNVSPAIKKAAPWLACASFSLGMLLWATHEKKQASAVGRFVKRQEILDNPELIMVYPPEQFKLAENIKGPKIKNGFFEKISENFAFFKKYLKDSKEYKNYKATTAKENEKLYEALKQTDISKTQLLEAKNLQKKTFRTFEKIDEMSQRYSEDTEAATQIAMQLISPVFSIIGTVIPLSLIFAVKKGKFPLQKVLKLASNAGLKKDSTIRLFVNKVCETVNSDKTLKKDFPKILINKSIKEKFINHPEIKKHCVELLSHNEKYFTPLKNAVELKDTKKVENISKEILNEHFKQDSVSKWIRNLAGDIFKFISKKKLKTNSAQKMATASTKTSSTTINPFKRFYNEYKTLSKTILFGGFIPLIGVTVGIPFVLASWMTNIQLKAGRIGIMKAMEEIDNPKLFVKDSTED